MLLKAHDALIQYWLSFTANHDHSFTLIFSQFCFVLTLRQASIASNPLQSPQIYSSRGRGGVPSNSLKSPPTPSIIWGRGTKRVWYLVPEISQVSVFARPPLSCWIPALLTVLVAILTVKVLTPVRLLLPLWRPTPIVDTFFLLLLMNSALILNPAPSLSLPSMCSWPPSSGCWLVAPPPLVRCPAPIVATQPFLNRLPRGFGAAFEPLQIEPGCLKVHC